MEFSRGPHVARDSNVLLSRQLRTRPAQGLWRSTVIALLLLLAAAMIAVPITSADVRARNLGTLPGDSTSFAYGTNNAGQVVGTSGGGHSFLWQNGTMTNIGTLGGDQSAANGINSAGQIVGISNNASGEWHAYLWSNGTMTDLGTLPGDYYSEAYGINDGGQVVGYSFDSSRTYHAFLWADGAMTDLGNLGVASYSNAFAINNRGQVVGGSSPNYGSEHAFLWQNGTMTDLGTLPGYSYSEAHAINDAGQVVGYASSVNASRSDHAFLWESGVMRDLGTLSGGYTSYAYGINEAGQVVGTGVDQSGITHAVLWQNGTTTDLGTLGGCCGVARDINDLGQIVGGSNAASGSVNAALWTVFTKPPPPYPIRDLGTPPGDVISWGTAINDAGHVAGYSIGSDSGIMVIRVFLWNNGTFQVLPGLGGTETFAYGVNAADEVVGYAYTASGPARAILWQNGTPTDLGTLGGTESGAYGINDRGQVVGWSYNATGQQHAFLWDQGNMTDLGTLPGGSFSTANAINDAGQVVGAGDNASGDTHAFLWQSGTMTDLGPGWANGINDVGQVVGASGSHAVLWENGGMVDLGWGSASSINHAGQIVGYGAARGETHGFLWYQRKATDLGTLPNDTYSQAMGINRDGQAAGFSGDQAHAVLWTLPRIAPSPPPKYPMRDLRFLPSPYDVTSMALGVNDDGQIVGGSGGAVGVGAHAFLWENGTMTDLGTLGGRDSEAFDINDAGQIVGWSTPASGGTHHAFLWENGVMTDLGTLGGDFSEAHAINEAGQIVGVSRTASGWDHAFLWDHGTMTDLGSLGGSPAYDYSGAYGVNEADQVVGWSANATEDLHAFLWENGTMTDIGTFGAYAINNAAEVVGLGPGHAVLWFNGTVTDLGTLGGGYSEADAINNGGQIVGGSWNGSGMAHAFLWENGQMNDLGMFAGDTQSWAYAASDTGLAVGESFTANARHAVAWTIPRPAVHDVAVVDLSASNVGSSGTWDVGGPVAINATVGNRGTQSETFDVSAYAGTVLVGRTTVTDLRPGADQDITFLWNTAIAEPGSYPLHVEASPVPHETRLSNNARSGVTVNLVSPVTAQASGTPSATDVGMAISFACIPVDGTPPYQFFWDFGDGSHWTDSTATRTFTAAGTKTATCTITDSAGKDSKSSTTVLVNPVPSVTVSVNHASTGPGAFVTFSAHVSGGTGSFNYVWNFGDEIAGGTGASVTHSYATAGEHRASVIVTDAVGGTGEESVTVMVSDLAITTEASKTQALTGEAISFAASATGAAGGPYAYSWEFGDGKTETGATVTHSYASAGTFTPKVTVTDGSGFSQEKALSPITVQAIAPSTSASPSVPLPIAGGLAVIVIVAVLAWTALRRKRP